MNKSTISMGISQEIRRFSMAMLVYQKDSWPAHILDVSQACQCRHMRGMCWRLAVKRGNPTRIIPNCYSEILGDISFSWLISQVFTLRKTMTYSLKNASWNSIFLLKWQFFFIFFFGNICNFLLISLSGNGIPMSFLGVYSMRGTDDAVPINR